MPLKLVKREGSKYWYITGTHRGERIKRSTGLVRKAAAEAERIHLEYEIEQRSIYGSQAVATFAEVALSYVKAGGEARFMGPVLEVFAYVKLHEIDQDMIDNKAAECYPNASPSTINRQFYTPVAAVLSRASRNRLFNYFPIKRPKQARGKLRWLEPYEAESLHDAAGEHLNPMIVTLLGTELRMSELLRLKWDDIDLIKGEAHIWQTKSGYPRKIELPSRVVATLAVHPQRADRIFLTPQNESYSERFNQGGQIRHAFASACQRAAIEDCTPHTLRHTWATWFYSATLDVRRLKHLGGWRSDSMVSRYEHLAPRGMGAELARYGWDFGQLDQNFTSQNRTA